MTNEDKFYEWWNGDEMVDDLDVVKHTPLYWAMQGWEAGCKAEREACAQIAFNAKTYLEAAKTIRARG